MHIAYICADPGVPVFGHKGCSIHVQEVIRALGRRGAKVDLYAASVSGPVPAGLEGVRVHRLSAPEGALAAREQKALGANHDLLRALQMEGPFDLVYERYSLWSFAGMEYAAASGTPGLLEINAPLIEEQAAYRGLVDRASAEEVAVRAFRAATVAIAVSEQVAAYTRRYRPDAPVVVVANGVDPTRFEPGLSPRLPAPPGIFTVGFVGSLKPWHGVSVLVEAFATLHHSDSLTRLLIVGHGSERARLEADVAERGLSDAVVFTGSVGFADVPGLLASMDVGVAPYPDLPGFYFSPLKVYEYMAAGLPVVASRIGQLTEIIEHDRTGVLCPPGDPVALALALAHLGASPEKRGQLGQWARAAVLRRHTWDRVAERILQLGAVAGRSPRRSAMRREPAVTSAGG